MYQSAPRRALNTPVLPGREGERGKPKTTYGVTSSKHTISSCAISCIIWEQLLEGLRSVGVDGLFGLGYGRPVALEDGDPWRAVDRDLDGPGDRHRGLIVND